MRTMKFEHRTILDDKSFYPEQHFNFLVSEDEVTKVLHQYGIVSSSTWVRTIFKETTDWQNPYQMQAAIALLQDIAQCKNVNLGINYKQKYEELESLLMPYAIGDMTPLTTLKMILKSNKL